MGLFDGHKLLTNHDPFHIHASLALLCVLHYGYRISLAAMGVHDMGFNADSNTLACMGLHTALSLSSLLFSIPARRIKEGSRIWPEFRLQSIIFALRSLALMGVVWWIQQYPRDTPHNPWWIVYCAVIQFVSMALSDWVASAYADTHSNTIRDLEAPLWMRYFFSVGQIHGAALIFFGTSQARLFSTQFIGVLLIQATAFAMTLIKKEKVSHWFLVVAYFFALSATLAYTYTNYYWVARELAIRNFLFSSVFAFARIVLNWDKYVIWTIAFGISIAFSAGILH